MNSSERNPVTDDRADYKRDREPGQECEEQELCPVHVVFGRSNTNQPYAYVDNA